MQSTPHHKGKINPSSDILICKPGQNPNISDCFLKMLIQYIRNSLHAVLHISKHFDNRVV